MTPLAARLQRSFTRSFATYSKAASVQGEIAATLAKTIPARAFDRVLEFGAGTGGFTRHLLAGREISHYDINDLVPQSANILLPLITPHGAKARFIAGPAEDIAPAPYDLIASASTIQWIETLPEMLARLCAAQPKQGLLALSGFGRSHFREMQQLGIPPQAPMLCDAPQLRRMLPQGYVVLRQAQWHRTVWFDDMRALFMHLRRTGVNGRGRGWTRHEMRDFCERYQRDFSKDGRVPLTYDATIMVAEKRA